MTDPLETLRRTYRERLVLQVEALKAVRESLQQQQTRAGAERSARRLAHRLRGSGGTLGFPGISKAAAHAEEAPTGALSIAIDSLLDEVRRAIRDQRGARPRGAALVIDDDPSVVNILRLTLAPYSDEVIAAPTIDEARAVLAAKPCALIVVDLGLPDGDARDLISQIGSDPSLSQVPVVVLSGSIDEGVRQECLALGATEVHAKPMDPVAMAASVRALLGYEGRSQVELAGDGTTGLPGPGTLFHAGLGARRQHARNGAPWSVAFIRVPEDEKVMAGVAEVLRVATPRAGTLVRWDARTFALLVAESGADDLKSLCEAQLPKIRRVLTAQAVRGFVAGGVMEATSSHPNNVFKLCRRLVELAALAGGDQFVASIVGEERRRGRVLLAEDDPDVAQAITVILDGELDLEVHHVPDGADAIALAQDAAFDLFVLDIEMPGADGLAVLRYLRSTRRYTKTPVVMVTALDSDRQMIEGLESGANDYVAKPFSPSVLAARIRRLL